MSAKAPMQMFGPHGSFTACAKPRRSQLSARSFQLQARLSRTTQTRRPDPIHTSWLHTTSVRREKQESPDSIDMVANTRMTFMRRRKAQDNSLPIEQGTHVPKLSRMTESFRRRMRFVTNPVVVVTSSDTGIDSSGGVHTYRGATVSSFTSVAIHPTPFVSFNIKKQSSTYDAIRNSKFFAVHVLANTSEAVEIARHFSLGNNADPFINRHTERLQKFVREVPAWPMSEVEGLGHASPPQLEFHPRGRTRPVLATFLCGYLPDKTVEVGDHVIVIGTVHQSLGVMEDRAELMRHDVHPPRECLTYTNGEYSQKNPSPVSILGPPGLRWGLRRVLIGSDKMEGEGEGKTAS